MSDSLLTSVLDECKINKDKISQFIPYLNNEPFLDVRMLDILRVVRNDIQVPVELSTNGSALTPATISSLVAEQLASTLRVSFFGATKSTYEARMRLPFDRATKNLQTLLDVSRGSSLIVELVMIATSDLTQAEIDLCRSTWEPLGAKVKIFGHLDRAGAGTVKNLLPFASDRRPVIGCDLNRPYQRIYILTDGRAMLCSQDWLQKTDLGNVERDGIVGVWNGEAYRALRARMSGSGAFEAGFICRKCKLALFG